MRTKASLKSSSRTHSDNCDTWRRPVPVPLEKRDLILRPDDVAAAVLYAVSQPARVLVEEIVLRPTTR